jgi:hypothetical protein
VASLDRRETHLTHQADVRRIDTIILPFFKDPLFHNSSCYARAWACTNLESSTTVQLFVFRGLTLTSPCSAPGDDIMAEGTLKHHRLPTLRSKASIQSRIVIQEDHSKAHLAFTTHAHHREYLFTSAFPTAPLHNKPQHQWQPVRKTNTD